LKGLNVLLIICFLISSCGRFGANKFVERINLVELNGECFFYDTYQTGVDNYTFRFFSANNNDTALFYEYYLNDAVNTAASIECKYLYDTLFIGIQTQVESVCGLTNTGTKYKFVHRSEL
jgi:predicted transcriptional regulator of viral defense system